MRILSLKEAVKRIVRYALLCFWAVHVVMTWLVMVPFVLVARSMGSEATPCAFFMWLWRGGHLETRARDLY